VDEAVARTAADSPDPPGRWARNDEVRPARAQSGTAGELVGVGAGEAVAAVDDSFENAVADEATTPGIGNTCIVEENAGHGGPMRAHPLDDMSIEAGHDGSLAVLDGVGSKRIDAAGCCPTSDSGASVPMRCHRRTAMSNPRRPCA
jgi:hypothetical protein